MRHIVPPTSVLEGVRHKAGAAVGEHVRDGEGQGGECLLQEGHGRGGGLVILDRQMHKAGGAVDGDVEVALAEDAVAVTQLQPASTQVVVDQVLYSSDGNRAEP
jgi:hypothetical protein